MLRWLPLLWTFPLYWKLTLTVTRTCDDDDLILKVLVTLVPPQPWRRSVVSACAELFLAAIADGFKVITTVIVGGFKVIVTVNSFVVCRLKVVLVVRIS